MLFFSIIALIAGIIYWLKTYVKESAKYYKMFMILYALGALVSSASTFLDFKNIFNGDIVTTSCVVTLIIEAIIFICVTVLAFAKDLGKKKSLYLVVTIIGLNIISFFVSIIANPNYIIVSLSNLLLACVAGVFVAAKYNNKASRGSN